MTLQLALRKVICVHTDETVIPLRSLPGGQTLKRVTLIYVNFNSENVFRIILSQ
jgi:hypothetical protein